MKRYFRQILVFCGAIAVLVLALGTFCTDQWMMKGEHHPHSGVERISHVEAAETMCHTAEAAIIAINPKNSESRSDTSFSPELGGCISSSLAFHENIDPFLRKTALSRSFGLARHKEVRYVVFRS